jgi:hypothetical protein
LDVSVVYNFLTLNVGPPLGLIKYKKERKKERIQKGVEVRVLAGNFDTIRKELIVRF